MAHLILGVRPLKTVLDDSSKDLETDGSEVRLRAGQDGGNEREDELFHLVLNLGVAHDVSAQSSDHVEGTESLRGSSIASQHLVDESEDRHEGDLRPVRCEGEEEGGGSGDRVRIALVLIHGDTNIVNRVRIPKLFALFIEGKLVEDEGGDEGVDVRLQLSPSGLGLDAARND